MSYSSSFRVSGTFNGDRSYQSCLYEMSNPGSTTPVDSIPKRKRNHDDFSQRQQGFPDDAAATTPGPSPYESSDMFGRMYASNLPGGTSTRSYVLAGQLDTPSGAPCEYGILGESAYSDSDYRRALGSKRPRGEYDMDIDNDELGGGPGPTRLFNLPPQPRPTQPGWGAFAFSALGGVVGRVWDLWRSSGASFRGFYAGGGKGFNADGNSSGTDEHVYHHAGAGAGAGAPVVTEKSDYDYSCREQSTPGRYYPSSESYHQSPPFDSESRASTPTRPAAKRRQTDRSDDLGRNWVMIGEPPKTAQPAPRRPPLQSNQPLSASPRNRNQAPSVTTGRRKSVITNVRPASAAGQSQSSVRRPMSRLSHAHSNSSFHVSQPASSASYASPRPLRSPSPAPSDSRRLPFTSTPSPSGPFGHRSPRNSEHRGSLGSPSYMTSSPARPSSSSQPNSWHQSPPPVSPSPSSNNPRRRRTMTTAPTLGNTSSSLHQVHRRTNSAASTASSRTLMPDGAGASAPTGSAPVDASPRLDPEAKHLAAKRAMEERNADLRMSALNKQLQDMIRQGKEALGTTIVIDSTGGEWEDEY